MASIPAVSKKVHVLGHWQEDIFSDMLLKKIADEALKKKGKKAKVTLSESGLNVTLTRLLKSSTSLWYPMSNMQAVTRNPEAPKIVMFIQSDPVKKYLIIAVTCATDADAEQLNNVAIQIKKKHQTANVEFRKRENGNWTLRERSAHNANRHMAELFHNNNKSSSADPYTTTATTPPVGMQNGGTQIPQQTIEHIPVLDASKANGNGVAHTPGTVTAFTTATLPNGDDEDKTFVIETEVSNEARPDDMTALKGKVNSLTHEVDELKSLLRQSSINYGSNVDPVPSGPRPITPVSFPMKAPASQPERLVYGQPRNQRSVVYQAAPNTNALRPTPQRQFSYQQPWVAGSRRSSAMIAFPKNLMEGPESTNGSMRVKFDTVSLASNSSKKSKSLRIYSSHSVLPNTIERSIENTYTRPFVLRAGSARVAVGNRPRPRSYHMVPANQLQVYRAKTTAYDDVAL